MQRNQCCHTTPFLQGVVCESFLLRNDHCKAWRHRFCLDFFFFNHQIICVIQWIVSKLIYRGRNVYIFWIPSCERDTVVTNCWKQPHCVHNMLSLNPVLLRTCCFMDLLLPSWINLVYTGYFSFQLSFSFFLQKLLWQSQLPSTQCCRLWQNDEKCLPQHEGTSTGHEREIKISFTGMDCSSLSLLTGHLLLQFISSLNIDVKWNKFPPLKQGHNTQVLGGVFTVILTFRTQNTFWGACCPSFDIYSEKL